MSMRKLLIVSILSLALGMVWTAKAQSPSESSVDAILKNHSAQLQAGLHVMQAQDDVNQAVMLEIAALKWRLDALEQKK